MTSPRERLVSLENEWLIQGWSDTTLKRGVSICPGRGSTDFSKRIHPNIVELINIQLKRNKHIQLKTVRCREKCLFSKTSLN